MDSTPAVSPPIIEPRPLAPVAVAGAAAGDEEGSEEEATDTPRTKAATRKWTDDEDALLQNAVKAHDGRNWKAISETLPDRSEVIAPFTKKENACRKCEKCEEKRN